MHVPRDLSGEAVMSRACPYTSRRKCVMRFPQREFHPSAEDWRRLQPVAGLLADLAGEYDEDGDGTPTSASDFVKWLQLCEAAS